MFYQYENKEKNGDAYIIFPDFDCCDQTFFQFTSLQFIVYDKMKSKQQKRGKKKEKKRIQF